MDIALVTGADAGPGLAIARRLIGMGCRVYALATQFSRNPFPHDDFITTTCDLADSAALTKVAEDIVAREGHISFVVHAARRAPAPLLDSPVATLAERLNVGLLAPLALARVTLPWLRKEQGHFVVLCWNGDGPAPGGPVTAAIEGGLHHFTEALFDELRSDGIRATTVYARPNPDTSPEAALALDPQSAINPELVADAIENLLRARPSNVVSQLVIRPAATAETPRILRSPELAGLAARDVQLPPRQHFPSEPESIPTPRPARPADAPPPGLDDFDDDEDEDYELEAEAAEAEHEREAPSGPPRQDGERQGLRPQGGQSNQRGYDQDRGQGRGRRRRGRGGRGRGRGQFDDRPPQGGGQQRPHGGGQSAPARPPVPRREYPDAEAEAEQRAFARNDNYRAPHSDTDEDNGGEDSSPPDEHREGREDHGPRDDSFREEQPAPVVADSREEFSGEDAPSREDRDSSEPREPRQYSDSPESRPQHQDRQRPPQHRSDERRDPRDSGQRGGQGGGQQRGGGGPRRHRGYGRRPPPGGGRGPGPAD